MTSEARFFAKTAPGENGCIVWTGCRHENGYGLVKRDGKHWLAHRLSWTFRHGEIPDGKNVLHRCDNPPCVNIEHLFLGSQQDNVTDMHNKGRAVAPSGADSGQAKLTEDEVIAIRQLRGRVTQRELAKRYGISQAHVSAIQRGAWWRHLAA